MAGIEEYLEQIKTAIYGKDVRQAIHDGIEACYEDGKAGAVDLVARQRIDQFTALPDGSTTGDAELIDGRIGDDNVNYTNIGMAIRSQVAELKRFINGSELFDKSTIVQGTFTSAGTIDPSRTNRVVVGGEMIRVHEGDALYFTAKSNGYIGQMAIGYFNVTTRAWIREQSWLDSGKYTFDGEYYIYIAFRNTNNTDITPSMYDATTLLVMSPSVSTSNLDAINKIHSDNQLTKFDVYSGRYMDLDGVVKTTSTWGMSEYVPVESNKTYNMYSFVRKNKLCGNVYIIYHDALKRFISSRTLQSATEFTTPKDCRYIVISCATTEGYYLYLTDSTVPPKVYKRYGQDTLFNTKTLYNRSRWGNTVNWAKMGINLFSDVQEFPKYPHGSKYSFLGAIYEGFDAILIDIIPTSDGHYVVSHDDNLYPYAKNADGTSLTNPYNIRQHTLAEVRALDMGYDYGDMYRGTHILTFEEALTFIKRLGVTLVIEMVFAGGVDKYAEMVRTVAKYGYTDNVIFFAYYPTELATVADIIPEAGLLLYVSGNQSAVNQQIQNAIALKTDKNKVIINQFADTAQNPLTANQIQTMIDNGLYYSVSTPTSEPTGFLNFMHNAPMTDYVTMFGTLNIPASKMLLDDATA